MVTLTGTVSVDATTSPVKVTGKGTRFTREISAPATVYIYFPSIGGYLAEHVASVESDTQLTLQETYAPESTTGSSVKMNSATFNNGEYVNSNYYDLGLCLYLAYYRTGNSQFLMDARKVTDSWWKSIGILEGKNFDLGQTYAPRNVSLGGLILRAMDGRPDMWPWITRYADKMLENWVGKRIDNPNLYYGIRDGGYMLQYAAWLAKVHPDPSVRADFRQRVLQAAVNYYSRLQYGDGSWRWEGHAAADELGISGYFMQPFMVGLLLDGLEAVHQLTGDPTVAQAIVKSVENLYEGGYDQRDVPGYGTRMRGASTSCTATSAIRRRTRR